jgi:Flp pilus assembly protein TadB
MQKSTKVAVYVLAALMFSTGMVYLSVAYDESSETSEQGESTQTTHAQQLENEENEANERESASAYATQESEKSEARGVGIFFETVFFSAVGVAYFPVGVWMVLKKEATKPYVIAMIGSAGLIAFYVATRMVSLPFIGIQDDVGTIDITSKILQGLIVVVSAYALAAVVREKRQEKLV